MKINKIYALMLLLLIGSTTACMDESDFFNTWDGVEVEFDGSTLPNGVIQNFVRASETQVDIFDLQVNLVAPPQNSAVTVNIEVDPSSTAIAGVHYNVSTMSVTIPAGSNVVNFPVEVLTGNIDPEETPNLVLRITSATGAQVSANYHTVLFGIRVICPSEISEANEVWIATSNSRFGTFQSQVTINPLGDGLYVISDISAGLYAGFGFSTIQEVIFSDNCNVISYVESRQTQFNLQPPSVEPFTSVFDPEEGILTIYWSDPTNQINGTTVAVRP